MLKMYKTLHYKIHFNQSFSVSLIKVLICQVFKQKVVITKKLKLSTGCITNTGLVADSTVQFHGNIAKVVDIVEYASSDKYFIATKYTNVDNFLLIQFFLLKLDFCYLIN